MKEKLSLFLVPRLAELFMKSLHATLRVRHLNPGNLTSRNDRGERYILAFWHCHILLMIFSRIQRPITVMISRHKDGEYIASTMKRFGVDASRGSSSRSGREALRELVQHATNGWNISITPDGPRGPARVAQPGVVIAAKRTGLPVVPVAVISERKKRLRSWDRFEIPLPFSRVIFVYGDPISIPPGEKDDVIEKWRLHVEERMRSMCDETDARFDESWLIAES